MLLLKMFIRFEHIRNRDRGHKCEKKYFVDEMSTNPIHTNCLGFFSAEVKPYKIDNLY